MKCLTIRLSKSSPPKCVSPAVTYLKDAALDGEQGDIEGTTTEVEDQHLPLVLRLLVQAVGDGRSSRLVDDAEDVQAGNQTGILGGLALGVVEVGRDGDHGEGDLLAQIGLGSLSHLDQDHGGDLLGERRSWSRP